MRLLFQYDRWLTRYERLTIAGVGMTLLILLSISAFLSPNPAGLGTHQQLGLPPCTLRLLFGIRCPSCGMTTSWSHMMHGHFKSSFASNSGGAILCILAILAGPVCFYTAIVGHPSKRFWFSRGGVAGIVIGFGAAVVEWIFRFF